MRIEPDAEDSEMSRELLVSDLRAWASVAWQHGSPTTAQLIQKAANSIESGQQDIGLAAEVITYSCQLELAGKKTFSEVLLRAADALTPRVTLTADSAMPGKASRPRSIVWDIVEQSKEDGA